MLQDVGQRMPMGPACNLSMRARAGCSQTLVQQPHHCDVLVLHVCMTSHVYTCVPELLTIALPSQLLRCFESIAFKFATFLAMLLCTQLEAICLCKVAF